MLDPQPVQTRPLGGAVVSSSTAVSHAVPSKTKVWPRPNYLPLVQRGHHPVNVMVLRLVYASLPTKSKARFHGAQRRLMDAIAALRDASLEWLEQATPPASSRLSRPQLQAAWMFILGRAFGSPSGADPCYFTRRHVVDHVGCMLYALLADSPPAHLLPTAAKMDVFNVELGRGWPNPPAPWERRSMFIVPKEAVSVETRGGATFARWPASSASDRGVFLSFDGPDDAQEWSQGLDQVLIFTDKPSTRLVATHPDRDSAVAALA